MPKATISPADTERFDLKTCPPDGYVELRRMPFDAFLHRQDIMMKMQVEAAEKGSQGKLTASMGSRETALFEFRQCIVDHNLEDHDGKPLDFGKTATFKKLDPRIGEEIQTYIEKMNRFLEDEHLGNSEDVS